MFDEINRLVDVKLNGAASAALHFDYDKLSRRKKLSFGNGVVTDYGFELDDDMNSLVHTFFGSSVTFGYGYNNVHEMTTQTASDSQFMWNPLTSYSTTYGTANNLNQYPTIAGTSRSYNANGCLTGNGTWSYSFDTENHLTSASKPGVSVSYFYDPLHRQTQKTVGSTKTRYIYAGCQRIADYDGTAGTLQNRYVYGTGLDEPLIQISAGGTLTYMHHDKIGSVIATTSNTGVVTNRYKYSPWGESTSTASNSFGFQGQRFDAESGLYFMKARYYEPSTGRFIQPDLIGYLDGLNVYQFARNAPNSYSDPFGLQAITEFQPPFSTDARVNEISNLNGTAGWRMPWYWPGLAWDNSPWGGHDVKNNYPVNSAANQQAAAWANDRFGAESAAAGVPWWVVELIGGVDQIGGQVNDWVRQVIARQTPRWSTMNPDWLKIQFGQGWGNDPKDHAATRDGYDRASLIRDAINRFQKAGGQGDPFGGWGNDPFGGITTYFNKHTGTWMNINWGNNTNRSETYTNKHTGERMNTDWGTNEWNNKNPWGDHGAFGTSPL